MAVGFKQQFRVSHNLSIDGMLVEEGDNLETPNTFFVKHRKKILELHCEQVEEKLEWQVTLLTTINENEKKKRTRRELRNKIYEEFPVSDTIGKTQPKWIKDQEVSRCMICTSAFTWVKRRHHCRACGRVSHTFHTMFYVIHVCLLVVFH